MHADDYQRLAGRTLIAGPDAEYAPEEIMLVWNALGVAGEAGEVADLVKKGVFHRHGVDRDKLHEELGDLLWYVAALCSKMGFSMDEVMARNVEKLRKRYPAGYSAEASQARVDVRP
jgi:NTP pyrophosphatase (non-canonical NTP hydrolase)